MIRCKEVATLLASDQLATAGFMKRISVNFHLFMCKYCSRFAKQIELLGSVTRKFGKATDVEKTGPDGGSLEARVLEKLSKP